MLQLPTVVVCFVCEVVHAPRAALGGIAGSFEPSISHNLVIGFSYFQETRGTNYVYITCVVTLCLSGPQNCTIWSYRQ